MFIVKIELNWALRASVLIGPLVRRLPFVSRKGLMYYPS